MPKKSPGPAFPVLTRRRFLEQLGLVGGSSLVMTAMTSWDLMAGQAGRARSSAASPRSAKVVVLGAGVSGLVVGYELGKLGYDYRVLEARDRVGGLHWTVRKGTEHTEIGGERQVCAFDEGQYVNVGPWRIPYTHTGVLNYCRSSAFRCRSSSTKPTRSYFFYEGNAAGALAEQAGAPARGEGRHDRPHQRTAGQGDRSEQARPAADGRRQGALRQVSRQPGLSRRDDAHLQGVRRTAAQGDPYELARAAAGPGSATACDRCRRSTARRRRRCSSRSAAWISSRRASSARSDPKRITFNAEVQSVHQDDTRREGRLSRYEERQEDRGHRRLRRRLHAARRSLASSTSTSRPR